MGLLVDGRWQDKWYDTASQNGRFVRPPTQFRHRIGTDTGFPAEAGRYHLYVSYACPWAHRTLIYRELKGLRSAIGVSVVAPLMLENGWELADGADPVNDAAFLWEIYTKADPTYSGRVTVPVLWDKMRRTIVNNESSEIIRIFDADFGSLATGPTFRPKDREAEIDAWNDEIYDSVNNGVYRAGFATTQAAYEEAYGTLFATLDKLERHLRDHAFLLGDQVSEADWRLFTTLLRFDAVYHGHFKCNRARLIDFPELWDYTRALYRIPVVADTVRFDHIKQHYYGSHRTINPTGIVPLGPVVDFNHPTRRTPAFFD
ncbi:glutathione S-transferase family protein [Telmatospirillum siberiense]|uniref:Glutathione-dependent reductase n=1 Tax=Telmatospirillum siberiense TaxID=382514 RepID=A0A2N3Q1G0_9PROT|nr:glutathione S-transferase family protein [Telmatospirillum siberiense]PKU26487.1 glutathione-dependent reductase [Telmatospirillum siberiense]